jgi:hypothetical protein
MIQAELRGKVPSRLEDAEDLLTSNVFSFFKYADRKLYFKSFLNELDILAPDNSLKDAEFRFWPRYDDCTEPDLVLLVAGFYVLIEAKHLSSFGEATAEKGCQIVREFEGGLNEAASLGKEFRYVAITSHYNKPTHLFAHLPVEIRNAMRWTNWQSVARLLLNILENVDSPADALFAEDLYNLLDKKKLRGFLPFNRIYHENLPPPPTIFFSAQSAKYRGDFIGFQYALQKEQPLDKPPLRLFYERKFFSQMPAICVGDVSGIKILLGGTL